MDRQSIISGEKDWVVIGRNYTTMETFAKLWCGVTMGRTVPVPNWKCPWFCLITSVNKNSDTW